MKEIDIIENDFIQLIEQKDLDEEFVRKLLIASVRNFFDFFRAEVLDNLHK